MTRPKIAPPPLWLCRRNIAATWNDLEQEELDLLALQLQELNTLLLNEPGVRERDIAALLPARRFTV